MVVFFRSPMFMRWILGLLGLLASCTPPRQGEMLHEMSAFAGQIEVHSAGSDLAQGYELSFARAKPYFSCKIRDGSRVITLLAVEGGGLEAYEDAKQRAPTAGEVGHFRLVSDLTDPRAIDAVEPGPDEYRLRRSGSWYTVRITPRGVGAHGHHPKHR